MKLFDDKRAAYLRLFALVDELSIATDEMRESNDSRGAAEKTRGVEEVSSELDELLALIEILAPLPVYEAAVRFSTAGLEGVPPRFSPTTSDFIKFIRYDLGTDETPPVGWA